jgi:hypothetical protein
MVTREQAITALDRIRVEWFVLTFTTAVAYFVSTLYRDDVLMLVLAPLMVLFTLTPMWIGHATHRRRIELICLISAANMEDLSRCAQNRNYDALDEITENRWREFEEIPFLANGVFFWKKDPTFWIPSLGKRYNDE